MFESSLDTERTFGHSREVSRTHLRRRRLAAAALLVLALSISAPAVSAAVTGHSSRRADAPDRYVVQVGDIVAMLVGEPGRGDMRALARGDVTTTVGLVLGSPDFQRR